MRMELREGGLLEGGTLSITDSIIRNQVEMYDDVRN